VHQIVHQQVLELQLVQMQQQQRLPFLLMVQMQFDYSVPFKTPKV
jgi:hypothetical protein